MTKALLYGMIGYQVAAQDVVTWLDEHKNESVEMHINSPGGDVFEAIAIRSAILAHKDITLVVDAMAASAAAVLSLCGKPLKMADYSRLMLHSASTYAEGNKKQMEEEIKNLESIDKDLAQMIADKLGKDVQEVLDTYFDGQDHWLTAEECIKNGFAEKYEGEQVEDKAKAGVWDCIFAKRTTNNINKPKEMDLTKIKSVGAFKDCTTEEEVVAKATEQSEELVKAQSQIADKDKQIADLEAKVKEFEDKEKKAQDEADEKVIKDAIEAKKMTAEQADLYRNMLKSDRENTLKLVDSLAPQVDKNIPSVNDYMKGEGQGEPKKSYFAEEMARIAEKK